MQQFRVLDLFSGLEGWSAGFKDRGHHVTTLDLDPRFGADIQADILSINALGKFDVILASPPCETFSTMTIARYWTGGTGAYQPKHEDGCAGALCECRSVVGLALMNKTFELIDKAQPRYYVIENPRAVMRKVAPVPPTLTTWYCRWGRPYAKPTDLWTNIEGEFPICRNRNPDHAPAPRGSRTGTQGENAALVAPHGRRSPAELAALRALVPYRLSLAVALAAERGGVLPPMDDVLALEAIYRPAAQNTEAA